jgi:hypothetical protein
MWRVALVSVAAVVVTSSCQMNSKGQRRVFDLQLPQNSGSIKVIVTNMHEFLAEYDYHVVIRSGSEQPFEYELYPQTGGSADLTVEWYPKSGPVGPFVKIDHLVGEKIESDLIDLSKKELMLNSNASSNYHQAFEKARAGKKIAIGKIDKDLKLQAP